MIKVNIWRSLVTGMIAVAMMTGCKNGKNNSGSPIELKFKVANGNQYEYKQDIALDLNMSGMNTQQKTATTFRYVAAPGPAQDKSLTLSYTRFAIDLKAMGSTASYNSDKEKDTTMDLSKHPFNVSVSPTGVIKKIEGLEFLQDKMLLQGDGRNIPLTELLSATFTETTMRSLLQPIFTIYPEKPVRNEDTWVSETNLTVTSINLKIITTYKLEKVTNGIAHVNMTSKITSSDGALNAGGIVVKIDVKGDAQGAMDVDVATGMLIESNLDLDAAGTMSAGPVKAPVKLTMAIKATGSKI